MLPRITPKGENWAQTFPAAKFRPEPASAPGVQMPCSWPATRLSMRSLVAAYRKMPALRCRAPCQATLQSSEIEQMIAFELMVLFISFPSSM